ncbi:FGGY-family carbohydrate kinase [Propionispora vibrioides]|uniref:Ribulokinase n=1 Tax=Propionispora vibrioides TaxID=112903 RepID=A0A1H8XMH4_9FIRM|nr:FGGY-family carbohydrate kinase [Propionispora vibrioides]SEP41304.1 ribulokinase [Propionispora vibrioides]
MVNQGHLFLGADFGTQGVRVGLADEKGSILEAKEIKYPIHYPKPGQAIQNSADWWRGFEEALGAVLGNITPTQKKAIRAISICATSSTIVPVDQEGTALDDAIMWMDIRAKEQARRINEINHEVLKYCGEAVSPEWLIPKLLWLKENKREIYDKASLIVEQIDLINYKLTDIWAASKVNAVCKWNYIEGIGFDDDYMEKIGLDDYKNKMIVNIVPMGKCVGYLKQELVQRYDLPDIPVIQGGIDAHIGMIGMGVVGPGKMAANMGTSFVQLIFTDQDVPVKGIWGPYKGAMVEGLTLLEAGQISAGSIIKWYQNIFNLNSPEAYKIMQEEVENVPIGADGLRALDFFQGNRTPYKDSYATGVITGLTLNHDRAHFHRAIMEAVSFGFKNIVKNFEDSGVPITKVIGTGGVTHDRTWMQILSDVTGKEFTINENTNYGTILGCTMLSAVGSGVYDSLFEAAENMVHEKETIQPNLENTKKYEKPFEEYLHLYQALKTV